MMVMFQKASAECQLAIVNELLCAHAKHFYEVDVPGDFVTLALNGMKHLDCVGKINVIIIMNN